MIRNILITIYILFILGLSATARAEYQILPVTGEVQTSQYFKGEVAVSLDGVAYLIVSDEQVYELNSKADLTAFNGQFVSIKGFESKYRIQPIEGMIMDPLQNDQGSQKAFPVLVVLKIEEIAE